jgi:hypothetical protein
MQYGPGSDVVATSAGYFLSDVVYLDVHNGKKQMSSYSAPIIFG